MYNSLSAPLGYSSTIKNAETGSYGFNSRSITDSVYLEFAPSTEQLSTNISVVCATTVVESIATSSLPLDALSIFDVTFDFAAPSDVQQSQKIMPINLQWNLITLMTSLNGLQKGFLILRSLTERIMAFI